MASSHGQDLANLDYLVFPRRTEAEAAVLEWGHSAIISALDASVAHFGPQTTQAALLEVECMPVLASPLNGVGKREAEENLVRPLDNADQVHGNMVVMTNDGGLSGVEMARIAKLSGAAALLVVNHAQDRPDDIHRLEVLEGENADDIDIPVVMISWKAAYVLTTATTTPEMDPSDVVNDGMPERVRLYAGGDRPFFEDIEPEKPILYLIHNLLTSQEADDLVQAAKSKLSPVVGEDLLQMTNQVEYFPKVERTMLWRGMLQSPGSKAIEEKIEQVTGYPAAHYSDWIVDRIEAGSSRWEPHYDNHPYMMPLATITVFLTESGGPIVYPSTKQPVKILPRQGTAIVHHTFDENNNMDFGSLHALLPHAEDKPMYVARKYVFNEPVSMARRIALPIFSLPFGGKLPTALSKLHDALVEKFGLPTGSNYFEQACILIPVLVALLLAQSVSDYVQGQMKSKTNDKTGTSRKDDKSAKSKKSD